MTLKNYDNWLSSPMADEKDDPVCPECGHDLDYDRAFGVWSCDDKTCEGYGMTVDFERGE